MQQKKNFFPVFLIFFVLAVVIFVLSHFGFLSGLVGFFENATVPLQRGTFVIFHKDDSSELAKLKSENMSLSAKLSKQSELVRENQALQDQFQTTNPAPQKLLPASVIGMPDNQIIIDKGQSDGIKTGFVVVVKDNLIGKIVKTSAHVSVVDIATSGDFSFTSTTVKTQANGVIKSQDGNLIFDNVVLSDKLQKDDLVVTKGDVDGNGVGFLPNLVVGKIVSVNKKASSLFQSGQVESLVEFEKLDKVFVIISN